MSLVANAIRPLTLIAAACACASAADASTPPADSGYLMGVVGSLGGLLLGVIQLVVGLAIVTFAIKKGLEVVSKLLGGLDIWGEVKKRNIAVALLAAGVVISYTNVLGNGIESMTKPLAGLASIDAKAWFVGVTGLASGLISLVIAIGVASFAITVTFKAMDRLTKDLDEKAELAAGNVAIGALYGGILIGVSQVVSSAIGGVSLAVQGFLSALMRF
jgi:uncharacterized membrane protein YjfL (UPF0719 family)